MPHIRGVILDVDGTLVDSNDANAHAWIEALAEHGHKVAYERVRRLIGMGGDNLLPTLIGLEKDTPEGEAITAGWSKIFETRYMPHLRAFPQVRELVQRMRDAGLRVVVASSAEEKLLKTLLDIARVSDLIEAQTSSSDAKKSKPDPDIVQAAIDRLGLPGDETVMLGDTPYDIESAGKAGVAVIGVRCGGWNNDELKGALAVYADPADLLAHYDESPLGRDHA